MPDTQTTSLTDGEIESTRQLLSKLSAGFLPLPIFLEVARLVALPIIEIIPLRWNDGHIEVLLTKRLDNDKHWPGMWHTPGTVVRATDAIGNYQDAFDRILDGELKGVALKGEPQFLMAFRHESKRGTEDAKVYYVEVVGEPKEGRFYDIDQLPLNIVSTCSDFVKVAAISFHESKTNSAA
jgi:hypothetical protein